MRSLLVVGFLVGLAVFSSSMVSRASAHEPHRCPAGFPDAPVISKHVEQADIVSGKLEPGEVFRAGKRLFIAAINTCDGQGRPATTGAGDKRVPDEPAFIRTSAPDASSCSGCHAQPRDGGAGDFVANVFVLAQALDPVTFSVFSAFSNERNTLGMMGAGPIEMLGREMTADLLAIRAAAVQEATAPPNTAVTKSLDTKGVNFGSITASPDGSVDTSAVKGVDANLIIKPFHQAGVVRSIREFTVNAFNHHHGMQAEERFDLNPAKGVDFDEDGVKRELTIGDVTAATIFQAALGTPGRRLPEEDSKARKAIESGEGGFNQIGCAVCHRSEMPLKSRLFVEPNPLNPPGTFSDTSQSFSFDMTKDSEKPRLEPVSGGGAKVRAFTDLKRHNLCDPAGSPGAVRFFCNEQLAQGRPAQDGKPGAEFFITCKLWDVGNSAPYGHRGDLTTITEAILAHGGEARASRDAFVALPANKQAEIVQFLNTFQVLPPGSDRIIIASANAEPLTVASPTGKAREAGNASVMLLPGEQARLAQLLKSLPDNSRSGGFQERTTIVGGSLAALLVLTVLFFAWRRVFGHRPVR